MSSADRVMFAALACVENKDRRRNRLGQHSAILGADIVQRQQCTKIPNVSVFLHCNVILRIVD